MGTRKNKRTSARLIPAILLLLLLCTALLLMISYFMKKLGGGTGERLNPTATGSVTGMPGKQTTEEPSGVTPKAENKPTKKAGEPTSEPEQKPTAKPTATDIPTPTPTETPVPKDITFSEKEYFFDKDLMLEISDNTGKSGKTVYTLDNTTPVKNGTVYSGAIVLKADDDDYPACYTVRAKSFYDDGTESAEFVHSYFVNTKIFERFSTTVIIISGEPSELTDAPDGILTGENYKERGYDSERMIHIEAVDKDGDKYFSQFAGARIYGGTSREHCIKSLKLYARKKYDENHGKFKIDVFGTVGADGEIVNKYDKLVLRNGGDDFQGAFLREELMQNLAEQAGNAFTENAVPAVCFVNGEYYGYYWLHENYCDDFFQKTVGEADGEYYVFESTEKSLRGGDTQLESELAYNYNHNFYDKYCSADLTDEENYVAVQTFIDIENYLDYMAFNVYINNYDWPQGNVKVMRYYSPSGEYEPGTYRDGRYYFLFHDSDIGTGCYGKGDICDADTDDLKRIMTKGNSHYSPFLTNLLKRDDCRKYFIEKLRSLAGGVLDIENVNSELEKLLEMRDGEMEYYITYLRSLKDSGIWCTLTSVKNDVETIRTFIKRRPEFMESFIEKKWGE